MTKPTKKLNRRLLSILNDDYEECQFFMAASNELTYRIKELAKTIKGENVEFDTLLDAVGQIGIYISHTEKRLEEVEDCYTMLVEAMSEEKKKKKRSNT